MYIVSLTFSLISPFKRIVWVVCDVFIALYLVLCLLDVDTVRLTTVPLHTC